MRSWKGQGLIAIAGIDICIFKENYAKGNARSQIVNYSVNVRNVIKNSLNKVAVVFE